MVILAAMSSDKRIPGYPSGAISPTRPDRLLAEARRLRHPEGTGKAVRWLRGRLKRNQARVWGAIPGDDDLLACMSTFQQRRELCLYGSHVEDRGERIHLILLDSG
jgi:hypothetical protein